MFQYSIKVLISLCVIFLTACSDSNDISHYTKECKFDWATSQYKASENLRSIDEQFVNDMPKTDKDNKQKYVREAVRIVERANKLASIKDDENLFIDELTRNIQTQFALKSDFFTKHQKIEDKVNKIKESLLEKIKGTQNKEEIIPLLATYLFIINNPQSTLK